MARGGMNAAHLLRAAVLAAAAAALVCVVVVSSSTKGATELASRDGGLLGLVTGQAPRGGSNFMSPNRLQQLASMMKQSDFPFALESGKPASAQAAAAIAKEPEDYADTEDVAAKSWQPLPALAAAQPQGEPTLKVTDKAQKLLTANEGDGGLSPIEEPKAEDNPIGLAEAAKILKDENVYDKAKESGALPNWKAAVAGSGKSILNEVTDDVTSFNPFPHKSLSEQMEVKAVWDKVNLQPYSLNNYSALLNQPYRSRHGSTGPFIASNPSSFPPCPQGRGAQLRISLCERNKLNVERCCAGARGGQAGRLAGRRREDHQVLDRERRGASRLGRLPCGQRGGKP